jgi:hypothetical protein
MWPATPTPFPAGIPPVNVATENFRMWEFAPIAINMWNSWLGPVPTSVGQVAIIIALCIAFVALLIRWLQKVEVDL